MDSWASVSVKPKIKTTNSTMANNEKLIVEERSRSIGNFMVGRLLPFRKKRQVGPFTFIDHMGPATLTSPQWVDVDQHPHIGLCTFTYLLEGAIEHRDSTGAVQIIEAGDVGMMTAGSGVTHTERTPQAVRRQSTSVMHGYQIWIALPKEKEEMEPRFDFVAAAEIPKWTCDGMQMSLLAGKAYGYESPLAIHSELFVLDITAIKDTTLDVQGHLSGEIAVLVNTGSIMDCDEEITAGQLMISKAENECCLTLTKGTRVMIFGGPQLQEERHLYWNFVSTSKERIEQARKDWAAGRFPTVPDDDTYIPLPSARS